VFDEAAVPAEFKEEIVTVKLNKTGDCRPPRST
jgi:hypothetical protein